MASRFTKIGAGGQKLAVSAKQWVAVLDNTTGLMWSIEEGRASWKKAIAWAKKLRAGGFKDWRAPTVEELFLLADRTKHSPAIDKAFFPDCKSDWYWTSTPAAYSPGDVAWFVDFDLGYSYWTHQDYGCHVRAVRSSQ